MVTTTFALILAVAASAGDLTVARNALRDGLWEVARRQASSVPGDEARLVVLESLAGAGDWDSVAKKVEEWSDSKGAAFDYYRAVVAGNHDRAMKILKDTGSVDGCAEAKLHEAAELAKAGDRPGAERIWLELSSATNLGERVAVLAGVNLNDVSALSRLYANLASPANRARVGLRLGVLQLAKAETRPHGEKLLMSIIGESPDADGAMEACLRLADCAVGDGDGEKAAKLYHQALETWPKAARLSSVQQGLGWTFEVRGQFKEALESFRNAEELATDDDDRALAILKQGDSLSALGRDDEAMAKYRDAMKRFPNSRIADRLRKVVEVRELETRGRAAYREFRFEEARKIFAEVAAADPSRRSLMEYFDLLCLYGQGSDDEAGKKAAQLAGDSPDPQVRAEAALWLAKFSFNRREWKVAERLFSEYARRRQGSPAAADALLWSARSAFAANDFERAVQISTQLVESRPSPSLKAQALVLQGEALLEQSRLEEAVLVFESAAKLADSPTEVRRRARMLLADANFAMGADNPVRYREAQKIYGELRLEESVDPSSRLVLSFKIARTLERLKRTDEAIDEYYAGVVIAYRDGRVRGQRFDESARADFTKAAFHLAEEYESRGQDPQALRILELVESSDVPSASEATKRRERIQSKGRFL